MDPMGRTHGHPTHNMKNNNRITFIHDAIQLCLVAGLALQYVEAHINLSYLSRGDSRLTWRL